MKNRLWLAAMLLSACSQAAWAACPSIPSSVRFTLNGAEATDKQTGLIWTRCSAGMTWANDDCQGVLATMTQEEALVHAKARSPWRLPTVKELFSLMDPRCGIDRSVFPRTMSITYITSTPYLVDATRAWAVHFSTAESLDVFRTDAHGVLLVREP